VCARDWRNANEIRPRRKIDFDSEIISIYIYTIDEMTTLPFEIIRVFADSSSSGNPAAVVLLPPTSAESATTDPSSLKALFPSDDILQATATLADQPMTAFALPLSEETTDGTRKFALRWFNPKTEAWLCGHATMATSAILFSQNLGLNRVDYISQKYGTLVAHRGTSVGLGVEVSMDFPELTEMAVMPEFETSDLLGLIDGATQGWDSSAVLEVWDSPDRTLVELKGNYDLAKLEVDCHKLVSLTMIVLK
jgi:predicted PhzF superfamily epimerase YddE/YHI9